MTISYAVRLAGNNVRALVFLTRSTPQTGTDTDDATQAVRVLRLLVDRNHPHQVQNAEEILSQGGIQPLVDFCSDPESEAGTLAASILLDMAATTPAVREGIRIAGGVAVAVKLAKRNPVYPSTIVGFGMIKNLSVCKKCQSQFRVEDAITPTVRVLRLGPQRPIAIKAARVLYVLSADNKENVEAILRAHAIEPLMALLTLGVKHSATVTAAAILGRLVSTPLGTQLMDRVDLEPLVALYRDGWKACDPKAGLYPEGVLQAVRTLRIYTQHSNANARATIRKTNGLVPLIDFVHTFGPSKDLTLQALGALSNICHTNAANRKTIVSVNGVEKLLDILELTRPQPDPDPKRQEEAKPAKEEPVVHPGRAAELSVLLLTVLNSLVTCNAPNRDLFREKDVIPFVSDILKTVVKNVNTRAAVRQKAREKREKELKEQQEKAGSKKGGDPEGSTPLATPRAGPPAAADPRGVSFKSFQDPFMSSVSSYRKSSVLMAVEPPRSSIDSMSMSMRAVPEDPDAVLRFPEIAKLCVQVLWSMAVDNPTNRKAIYEAGSVELLVGLFTLPCADRSLKIMVAGALWCLTDSNRANRKELLAQLERAQVPVEQVLVTREPDDEEELLFERQQATAASAHCSVPSPRGAQASPRSSSPRRRKQKCIVPPLPPLVDSTTDSRPDTSGSQKWAVSPRRPGSQMLKSLTHRPSMHPAHPNRVQARSVSPRSIGKQTPGRQRTPITLSLQGSERIHDMMQMFANANKDVHLRHQSPGVRTPQAPGGANRRPTQLRTFQLVSRVDL